MNDDQTRQFEIPEIKFSLTKVRKDVRILVKSPSDAFKILTNFWSGERDIAEEVYFVALNHYNEVIGVHLVFKGGLTTVDFDQRTLLRKLVASGASSFYLAHNHPQGNCHPSPNDILATKELNIKCDILGIKMEDHLIVCESGFFSMMNNRHNIYNDQEEIAKPAMAYQLNSSL